MPQVTLSAPGICGAKLCRVDFSCGTETAGKIVRAEAGRQKPPSGREWGGGRLREEALLPSALPLSTPKS